MTNDEVGKGTYHIKAKDLADQGAMQLRAILDSLKNQLALASQEQLYSHADDPLWYKWQTAHLKGFKNKAATITNKTYKSLNVAINTVSKSLKLTTEQMDALKVEMVNTAKKLNQAAFVNHKKTIGTVGTYVSGGDFVLESNVAPDLRQEIYDQFQKHPNGNLGTVEYPSGQKVSWEAYMERKVRTEFQQEINQNMIAYGHAAGVVFFLASYYGDCAPDHQAYQGLVYYDEGWEDNITDDDLKNQIQDYITSHKLMSVQEVSQDEPWLTTRPNCRHYFSIIGIEEVLNIKTNKDLNDVREEQGMNYNGHYEPYRYDKLQEQRYNERMLRKYKEQRDSAQAAWKSCTKDTPKEEEEKLHAKYQHYKKLITEWNERQKTITDQFPFLERDTNREKPNNIYNVGVKRK